MPRHKHKMKEYEALFKLAEQRRWDVTGGGNKHFKMKCPNKCKCLQIVGSTPSTKRDFVMTVTHLRNATCWEN